MRSATRESSKENASTSTALMLPVARGPEAQRLRQSPWALR